MMVKSSKKPLRGDSCPRPSGLSQQLLSTERSGKVRKKNKDRAEEQEQIEPSTDTTVDQFLTEKILKQARKQQDEIDEEFQDNFVDSGRPQGAKKNYLIKNRNESDSDSEAEFHADQADYEPDIDASDEKALQKFMLAHHQPHASGRPRLLCDVIMQKIDEKRSELDSQMSQSGLKSIGDHTDDIKNLDPRLVEMYRNVGKVLSTYRSGKLPKAFKIVPKLTNWEQILFLTAPEKWSAASMYQATKIFVSNLNPKMCQRFLSLILLPRIRDDIAEYKKLNFHLYQALGKALFKPAAFFKAILLPICESGNCTLREATIIGSLLTKWSVPSLHAAAAMLKIAEMNYSGANSLFLRLLIDKKYTLPFRVIDGLVNHFVHFMNDERQLPVLWHQSLLVFCQRYKNDLSSEQKDHLLDLIKKHYHPLISPEVRRELCHADPRDVEDQEPIFEVVDEEDDIVSD